MRIGADLRPFLKEETGVGVYFRNLLLELAALDRRNEYFLFSSSWKDRFAAEKIPPFAHVRFRDLRVPVRAVNYLWQRWRWPTLDAVFGVRLDLTHSPTPLPLPTRGRKVVTVYDLFFLDEPDKADREARRVFARRIAASLADADGVLTISEFTRRALLTRFALDEKKVRATPLGLGAVFREEPAAEALTARRAALALPERFLLFVGAIEPRKNLPNLLSALGLLRRRGLEVPLIVVGRDGEDSPAVRKRLAELGLEEAVRFLGYRPEREIRDLYRLASVFVYPSFSEGFGLPVVEAMASGVPVVASAAGALPEVGGDAVRYVRPGDPEDIAAGIAELLSDGAAARRLCAAGRRRAALFSWEKTAAATLTFYEEVAGRQ
jgi:glycosyltransferase involved in cell wall biosynthesis